MADTTPEINRTDEDYSDLSIHLSGVQCLPDFTENIATAVEWTTSTATQLETFIGDRLGKIASYARRIGSNALYFIHEGRDNYPE